MQLCCARPCIILVNCCMREIQIATIFSAYNTGNILLDDTYTSWKKK